MKKILFFLTVVCFAASSCTKEKTDYEATIDAAVTEYAEFEEAARIHSGAYDIRMEALNGTLYKGYNDIRITITDSQTNEKADVSAVTFLPVKTNGDGENSSCPHRYELV